MNNVEIYTKSYCPYCQRAKELLRIKGISFQEHDITHDPFKETEMRQRARTQTVPQIFIAGTLLGGCSDLFELDEKGALDALLGVSRCSDG